MQNKEFFTKEEVCEMLREMQMETVKCQGFIIGHVTQLWVIHEMLAKRIEELGEKGIETARLNGKQIGQIRGSKLTTKKSIQAKELIQKYSKDFDGSLYDVECIRMIGISKGSYYKYKRELLLSVNRKSRNYS